MSQKPALHAAGTRNHALTLFDRLDQKKMAADCGSRVPTIQLRAAP